MLESPLRHISLVQHGYGIVAECMDYFSIVSLACPEPELSQILRHEGSLESSKHVLSREYGFRQQFDLEGFPETGSPVRSLARPWKTVW